MRRANGIKLARVRAGLSQTELAERIGVAQATVVQWEKDANTPTKKNQERIAEACGVTVDELLDKNTPG